MAKGPTASLLSASNGGMTFDTTKGTSKCSRCKVSMKAGTKVGLLKVKSAGFTNNKRLCIPCANEVIEKTQKDLDAIRTAANQ